MNYMKSLMRMLPYDAQAAFSAVDRLIFRMCNFYPSYGITGSQIARRNKSSYEQVAKHYM